MGYIVDYVMVDRQDFEKFENAIFSRYSKFLLMCDWKWSKAYPVFFLFKISQQIQSLEAFKVWAEIGCSWQADCKILFVNLAQTCDKQMLKISERYLDFSLSNGQITENLLLQMASS